VTSLVALGSALSIGSADFLGGLASRRAGPLAVAVWVNLFALLLLVALWLWVQPQLSTAEASVALAAGALGAIGISLIYAAFAAGAMSLAAPLIACGSALVPTAVATLIGDPPNLVQSAGIVFALMGVVPITWTPSRSGDASLSRRALVLTALASVVAGVAVSLLLVAGKDGDAEVAVGVAGVARMAGAGTSLVVALAAGTMRLPQGRLLPLLIAISVMDAGGTCLLLIAGTLGNTAVVAVLGSLYAIVTVLLAQTVLRERIVVRQAVGILLTTVGVTLLSVG
jgi:drug/metabolite transporter (DMT)-like permease